MFVVAESVNICGLNYYVISKQLSFIASYMTLHSSVKKYYIFILLMQLMLW